MAIPAQHDVAWSDFDNLRHSVKSHTVDRLKHIISGLNDECNAQISKTGKKQELIDRITSEFDRYRYLRQTDHWNRARAVLYQVRSSGSYTSSSNQPLATGHNFSHTMHGPAFTSPKVTTTNHYSPNGASSSSIGRYDPYAPPRRAVPSPSASTSSPVRTNLTIPMRFKPSPFYRVDQAASAVVECPESASSMDRRSQTMQFALSQEHINKLTQSSSKYQLRLYCTTNAFYSPSPTGFRSNTAPCPIEFPATCEVRVNGTLLTANLKGIKKKPGTAPPADLTKTVRMNAGIQNKIDMIYVNSQPNSGPKKFYLVVFLVEVSSVELLVERLRKGKFRTLDEIKGQLVKSSNDDDEIVAGRQKMSLKCPLSYTRIKIPCRSDKCVHPQCFDATSWYSVMEQTTTWLCPVCEKMLNPEDLIVDGFFDSILKQTPESVEEVEVEPDGEWHTNDGKHGSQAWKDAHPSKASMSMKAKEPTRSFNTASNFQALHPQPASSASASGSRRLGEVVILDSDSDNEDEGRIKKELSPVNASAMTNGTGRNGATPSNAALSSKAAAVIDLTLDSDTEDVPPNNSAAAMKRKASEAQLDRDDDSSSKRMRPASKLTASIRRDSGAYYSNEGASASSGTSSISPYSRTLPPLSLHAGSSASNHRAPPSAASPSIPYDRLPHPSYAAPSNAQPYRANNGSDSYGHQYNPTFNQRPTSNATALPLTATTADPRHLPLPTQTTYNPYHPRPNGQGGTWP